MLTSYLGYYDLEDFRKIAPTFSSRIPSPVFWCDFCQEMLSWRQFTDGHNEPRDLGRFCVPCGSRPLQLRAASPHPYYHPKYEADEWQFNHEERFG